MKTLCLIFLSLSTTTITAQTKNSDEDSIRQTLIAYAKAGDEQNVEQLSATLHDAYRLVWNGGKEEPFISNKKNFLSQFEKKEWGGDKRQLAISTIEIFDGFNAIAKVTMDGEKAEMRNFFTLIKVEGSWLIMGELVNATFK